MTEEKEFREKITNFIADHENHLNFYKCVWQNSKALEACSSNLKNSIIRLIEGTTEINTELETITDSIKSLKHLLAKIIIAHSIGNNQEKLSQQNFRLPFNDPNDNQLSIQLFLTLKDEQEILRHVTNVSALIRKALSLIEMIDLSPQAVCADLAGKRQIEKFLLMCSEVVGEAAAESKVAAELVQSVDARRMELEEKARQLGIERTETKQEDGGSYDESYLEFDGIFRNIKAWAQENLSKALFQFKENAEDFKFLRVSEISKVWIENNARYNVRTVDALIEYDFGGAKKRNVSFQIDYEETVVGFNLYEPIRG